MSLLDSLLRFHRRIPLKWWSTLTALTLLGMLLIGLRPSDFYMRNQVAWLENRAGLRFEKTAIAYTAPILDLVQQHIASPQYFSVEIALKSKSFQEDGFRFIFLLHSGDDGDQLLIAQWRSLLIVMNDNDYANRRRTGRLTVRSPLAVPDVQMVTLTVSPEGSRVYCNGRLMEEKKQLRLTIPLAADLRLLLGNSISGRNPWEGEIYGVAIHARALSGNEAADRFREFNEDPDFFRKQPSRLLLSYAFDEKRGAMAANLPDAMHPLHIPSGMAVLKPRFFFQISHYRPFTPEDLTGRDAMLNFFGFIPLGVLLAATLAKRTGGVARYSLVISLAIGFLLSLGIETIQAWMPERSSDLRDLILNSAGTLVGAVIIRIGLNHANRPGTNGLME